MTAPRNYLYRHSAKPAKVAKDYGADLPSGLRWVAPIESTDLDDVRFDIPVESSFARYEE